MRLPAFDVSFLFCSHEVEALQRLQQILHKSSFDVGRAAFLLRGKPIRD